MRTMLNNAREKRSRGSCRNRVFFHPASLNGWCANSPACCRRSMGDGVIPYEMQVVKSHQTRRIMLSVPDMGRPMQRALPGSHYELLSPYPHIFFLFIIISRSWMVSKPFHLYVVISLFHFLNCQGLGVGMFLL